MRIHVFQNVAFEGPANVAAWSETRGHGLAVTRWYADPSPPPPEAYDLLAIMGGPMNIYQHAEHPWLVPEKREIHRAISADRRIVGICLGAQLLADALGGAVTRDAHTEIGWFPVSRLAGTGGLLSDLPETFEAFHWHGDTYALPPEGEHLARSEACAHQICQVGPRMIALQCHLDYSPESIETMLTHCGGELADGGPFVQTAEDIRHNLADRCVATRAMLFAVLDRLAEA